MAFDFPNSPSVGQRVTGVGGIVYVWDGVKWTNSVGGVTVQSMGDVGRNLIHNPLFNVTQRGQGAFTGVSFTADRWQGIGVSGDTISTIAGFTLTDADRAAIGDEAATQCNQSAFTGVAAGETVMVHKVEWVRRLSGKTLTLSFWAHATSGTPKISVSYQQNFGFGGSPSASVKANIAQTAALSTTWTRYMMTFTLPSGAAKTYGTTANTDFTELDFFYSCGSTNADYALSGNLGAQSGTIQLWGVQLEIGSVATPLEKPDPRYDLANCQRFYQVNDFAHNGYALASNVIGVMQLLPVQMRGQPTVVINLTSNTNGTGIFPLVSKTGCEIYLSAVASAGVSFGGNYTASADL